jgi:hypothetical protein
MNLREMAQTIRTMKLAVAAATDGVFIGIDTVSGGPYTGELLSTGKVVAVKGVPYLLVDAIAYPAHEGDSGKSYKGENRFTIIEIDLDTLEFTGVRKNIGFNSLSKKDVLGDVWAFVEEAEKHTLAAKAAAAEKAAQAARAQKALIARMRINNF